MSKLTFLNNLFYKIENIIKRWICGTVINTSCWFIYKFLLLVAVQVDDVTEEEEEDEEDVEDDAEEVSPQRKTNLDVRHNEFIINAFIINATGILEKRCLIYSRTTNQNSSIFLGAFFEQWSNKFLFSYFWIE